MSRNWICTQRWVIDILNYLHLKDAWRSLIHHLLPPPRFAECTGRWSIAFSSYMLCPLNEVTRTSGQAEKITEWPGRWHKFSGNNNNNKKRCCMQILVDFVCTQFSPAGPYVSAAHRRLKTCQEWVGSKWDLIADKPTSREEIGPCKESPRCRSQEAVVTASVTNIGAGSPTDSTGSWRHDCITTQRTDPRSQGQRHLPPTGQSIHVTSRTRGSPLCLQEPF